MNVQTRLTNLERRAKPRQVQVWWGDDAGGDAYTCQQTGEVLSRRALDNREGDDVTRIVVEYGTDDQTGG